MTLEQEVPQTVLASGRTIPSVFVAVGGPRQMDDSEWSSSLKQWAASMPLPEAVLMFSAHWLRYPVTLGATSPVPLVYDYYNFPARYYQVQYPAPPAPALARRVTELLGDQLELVASDRGLDHGAFIGLMGMYPEAGVPVLEVSIPTFDPEALFAIGRYLAPLRSEGVMVMGAGLLTHSRQSVEENQQFVSWVLDVLARRDLDSLLRYRAIAPGVQLALPTVEHFAPLLIAYGAAFEAGADLTFGPGQGGMRCLQFN